MNELEHFHFRKALETVNQVGLFEFDELSLRLSSGLRQVDVAGQQRRGSAIRARLFQFVAYGALPCLVTLAIKQNHRGALGKEFLVVLANARGVPFEEWYLHFPSPTL